MQLVLIGPVYPYRGGISHYTTLLYRALRRHGHSVQLISFRRQYPQWLFPGRSDKDPSEQPLEADHPNYWIDSLNPLTWLTTFRRIRRWRPDALVLQWWTSFWAPVWFVLGLLNHLFLGRPLIYICHNVLPHETRPWDPCLVRLGLRWGTHFIVQSAKEKERLLVLMPEAQVDIVPHPIYDMFADQQMTQEEARTQLGLPGDIPILLFFGIIREYKGLKDLLAALPDVRSRMERLMLLVAGEFWDDKQLYQAIVEEQNLDDCVVLEDRYIPNEELPLYFCAADALVAPYRQATGSGVVKLAHGFSTPVMVSSVCVQQEVGEGHDLTFPPGDPEALASTILFFFETHSSYDEKEPTVRAGDRGVSWDRLVNALEDIEETQGIVER